MGKKNGILDSIVILSIKKHFLQKFQLMEWLIVCEHGGQDFMMGAIKLKQANDVQ